jgi:glutamyl-tRNA synthetase
MNTTPHIITRFAPSPTGNLHIGSARTALFNYLYAKANQGKFLLRIDDTDFARSKPEYTYNIMSSLEFLGIDWDNKGYEMHQSTRMEIYKEIAYRLVEQGLAYKCYVSNDDETPALLDNMNDRKNYLRSYPGSGSYSIRFKMPMEGIFQVVDTVNGEIEIKYESLDDFTLLRQDGTATYMFSSVVDDEELKITNIIRGTEHLPNTYRQLPLVMALGYQKPIYTHIPVINNAEGRKLSKRLDATSVQEYAEMGILPEALCNYVLRLGWGHGDVDIISMEEVIKIFSLDGLRPSPARFDMDKLLSLNAHYIKKLSPVEILNKLFIGKNIEKMRRQILICIPNMAEKANNLKYIEDMSLQIFENDFPAKIDDLPNISEESFEILNDLDPDKLDYSSVANTKSSLTEAISEGDKREIMMFLRVSLTGMRVSPGLFEIINALGPDLVKKRLHRSLSLV